MNKEKKIAKSSEVASPLQNLVRQNDNPDMACLSIQTDWQMFFCRNQLCSQHIKVSNEILERGWLAIISPNGEMMVHRHEYRKGNKSIFLCSICFRAWQIINEA